MPSLLRMSTPTVGPSRISTFGLVASHLASTTRCWLPPESVCAAAPTPAARMSSCAIQLAPARPPLERDEAEAIRKPVEHGDRRYCRRSTAAD